MLRFPGSSRLFFDFLSALNETCRPAYHGLRQKEGRVLVARELVLRLN